MFGRICCLILFAFLALGVPFHLGAQEMGQPMSPMDEGSPSMSDGGQTMPTAPCDPFHLFLCQDEEHCQAAGGYWYEGRCLSREPEETGPSGAMPARHYEPGENVLGMITDYREMDPGPAMVGCDLLVPPEDQGKEARLLMMAYSPDLGWVDLSGLLSPQETRLSNMVHLGFEVDLSPFEGKDFAVCCGYQTQEGQIGYHCYELEVRTLRRQECFTMAQARKYRPGEDVLATIAEMKPLRPAPTVMGCDLLVPPEDWGKEARLLMMAYSPDLGWVDLSDLLSPQETRLSNMVHLGFEVDLSPFEGKDFAVCCGYQTQEGQIGYHCYGVEVR